MNNEQILNAVRSIIGDVLNRFFIGRMPLDSAYGALFLAASYIDAQKGCEVSKEIVQEHEDEPEYYPLLIPEDDEIQIIMNDLIELKEDALRENDKRHSIGFIR